MSHSLLLIPLALCVCLPTGDAILGGRPANIQQTPYTVQCTTQVKRERRRFSAVIIDTNLVLTLAYYCTGTEDTLVYPGLTDLADGEGSLRVNTIRVHERYQPATNNFNFCIMKVERGFKYSKLVQHAALASPSDYAPINFHATFVVSGWGRIDNSTDPPVYPPKMILHEFRFKTVASNQYFINLVPDDRLFNHHKYDKTAYGDGGGACLHRASAKVYGLIVDDDKIRNEQRLGPMVLKVQRQCILIGPAREWIENARFTINEG